MGLNASKLKKQMQGGGKKKGKAATAERRGGGGGGGRVDATRKEYMFQMWRVSKTLPNGKELLKDINLAFFPGAKIGVVGSNGAGKSTLLRVMAGVDTDFEGEARPLVGATIGFLPQEPELNDGETVQENVEAAVAEVKRDLRRLEELSHQMADMSLSEEERERAAKEMDRVQAAIEAADGYNLDSILERALEALRAPPGDARVATLSGGERRRVALVRLLIKRPDLLLLDEPTNHLDAESVLWLEQFLSKYYTGTVVAITHSRSFLENTCEWILEMDGGRGIPHQGNYSSWLQAKQERLALDKKEVDSRRRLIEAELEWIRATPSARQAKNKARVDRFEELYSRQRGHEADSSHQLGMNQIVMPVGPHLGDVVIEAEHLCKAYGERALIHDATFSIPRGSVVGIIGGNGAGKSTLFRMIIGQEQPDSGVLRVGETVKLMYADQSRESLNAAHTVYEEICGGKENIGEVLTLGTRQVNARAYCSWFNFRGADQQKLVGQLSGGERNRLNLAKAILNREHGGAGNVLLLDEPGNDLDTATLANLEQAILDFPGVVLAISHDPWFLSRVATHILAFEGNSELRFYTGGFEEYQADKAARLGAQAVTPSRMKFRPLPKM
ncbi:hypothetical protein CDCA_CDCA09G2781 [Cyanidium caldarium]|uniref:Probable ATP-dependent transporter ycf16 n=1 Tax=Cyanidium caldarium TaxID=2771 RepID=A0AAV9IXE5_CYACA|nr:hypothetical protein CDCA_CDCA09G2781 [Cyanidium caldarium]